MSFDHQEIELFIINNISLLSSISLDNSEKSIETKKVAIWVFVEILKISHSIMPFITEKLWQVLVNESFLINQTFIKHKINDILPLSSIILEDNYFNSPYDVKTILEN